ncbi:hypothetical protein [Saccharomonospora halophila]|uniref:hypothetical protein n=1 Tax=Saccharomonospora halophila TaxID=129922 RepID=UPI00035F9941|nr:hypothetical protein [Saccharomonospora halophila]
MAELLQAVAGGVQLAVGEQRGDLSGGDPAAPALSDLSTGSARITIRGGSERSCYAPDSVR